MTSYKTHTAVGIWFDNRLLKKLLMEASKKDISLSRLVNEKLKDRK